MNRKRVYVQLFLFTENMSDASRREIAQFHAYHVFINLEFMVRSAIMNLKGQPYKAGQNSAGSGVCANGRFFFSSLFEG